DKFTRLKPRQSTTVKDRDTRYTFADMIGQSPIMLLLRQQALRASQLDSTLLLLGETGTGKELLAQAIHNASPRSSAPFVGVNTAALPETLVEAELFGAAPGAYTGADSKGRKGKFELANGGTLFLDEIGEMSAAVQAKLLRVLQEREIEPLGSNKVVKVDVRVVAATSRNLEKQVADGVFRADLYYRLNVLPLTLPPLRERLEDLPQLCHQISKTIAEELGASPVTLDDTLLNRLKGYHWPGNIRELRNVLERLNLFADQDEFDLDALGGLLPISRNLQDNRPLAPDRVPTLAETVSKAETEAIRTALSATANNRSQAAKLLGISRASLYEKLNKLSV
ncbi:MAG: sigma 54-interacting transcriptional regulator, partial [Motiliproteus sp.]|nr:sigma 54-interacting transcriptional regulator [Motiliproteus sp.]